MIGQKSLGTLNYATRSIVSVHKIRSNEYNRHIKVVPLGDVNLFMLKAHSLETIFIAICILPKTGVNKDIVAVMSHGHELGQGWVPEDGIVWQANVGDVKVNELGAVVVGAVQK